MADKPIDVKEVFNRARQIAAPEERLAFLQKECGHEPAALGRIRELLRIYDQEASFLESSPVARGATIDHPQAEGPGAVIGGYKLLEQIGEGGFGVVFMAEQTHPIRRKVALKVLKPGMDTRQVVARFEAERQALAIMDHPNIAKVFDGGSTGGASVESFNRDPTGSARVAAGDALSVGSRLNEGRPYFVMELVKGVPITEFCDQNHLTPRERLELFIPVCQAVHHAHQKGIIHRDLKPTNILVVMHDTTPAPKVIDFGIAKALGQELTDKTLFTGFAQMIGTPLYMSPEQAGQSGLDIDTRSDIYSLGVLLYELLTGTTPFDKERLGTAAYDEVRRIIREEEPLKPSTRMSTLGQAGETISANRKSDPKHLRQLLRGELDWIVMKALEKDRNRRYESASTFAGDVQRYLNDEHVLACPPSAAYLLRKFVRRHKGPVLAASLVVLALVVGIVGTTWGMLRATSAEADAIIQANHKEAALTDKVAALADAKDKLFLALVNQARAERSSGRVGQRFKALKTIRQAAQIRITPELRTEALGALVLPDVGVAQEWEGWPEDTVGVAFDAEFKSYARLDKQGGLTVCRLSEGREEVITRLPAHGKQTFGGPWMSPDGRFVAYAHSFERPGAVGVRLWKLGSEPAVLLDEPAGMHELALAFHPSGRQLAIGHADSSASVYDLATGQRMHRLVVGAAPNHLAFHPRELRLAIAGGNAVQLFDTDTGQELPALRHPTDVTWTHSVAWHPDGRRLAVGCNDGKIHIWDTETAAEVMSPWTDPIATGMFVAFNHAGDRLVSVDWGGQTGFWDAPSGRLLLTMPGNVGLQFSPDDRLLGYSRVGAKLRLWRLANSRELRVLRRRNADSLEKIRNPVVHADGRALAAYSDHWLNFFDLISGEELASVRLPRAEAAYPVFFDPANANGNEKQEQSGGWMTGGYNGLFLWPARRDSARPEVLSVGPPQRLAPGLGSPYTHGASASADGRVVAVPQGNLTVVLHRDHPDRRVVLGSQFDVRFSAVSPDGRWVVTGSHWEDARSKSARIWDAESGEQIHELQLVGSTVPRFSPDGRWLMTHTSGAGCRLWEVGAWREVRRFDYAGFTFSPDSRLLAINDVFSVIRLVETTTGREVARLTGPEPMWYYPACFTPDGTRLITTCSGNTALYVWDLRLIRQQLKEMDLDWHWPEFAPADSAAQGAEPVKVEILGNADELMANEGEISSQESEKKSN